MQAPKLYLLACLMLALSSIVAACDDSSGPEAKYLERGKTYYHSGDFEKAREELKNVLRINPKQPEAFFYLGLMDADEFNPRAAYGKFRRVLTEDPDHVGALLRVAEFNIMAGNLDRARRHVDRVAALEPDNPHMHSIIASIHLMQEDYALAEEQSRRALSIDPGNVSGAEILARALSQRGEWEQAIAVLDQTLQHVPWAISLRRIKIGLLKQAEDFSAVESEYLDISALQPDTVVSNNRGDELNAIDGDVETSSFLTPSRTSTPNTVAVDVGVH